MSFVNPSEYFPKNNRWYGLSTHDYEYSYASGPDFPGYTSFEEFERPAPPPPNRLPFDGRGGVALLDEPFDWDDGVSISSQGSSGYYRQQAASALFRGTPISSQKHPIVDAGLNIYVSQLRRALTHYGRSQPDTTPEGLQRYHEARSLISPDFFFLRQNPPLAGSPPESAQLVEALNGLGLLSAPKCHFGKQHYLLREYITEASLFAAVQKAKIAHPSLESPLLKMVVVALNMSRDAGLFEFFELRDIYGIQTDLHVRIDEPLSKSVTTTFQACQMHSGGGHVSDNMIRARENLVAKRKQEIHTLVREHTAAKRQATALFDAVSVSDR